MKNNSRKREGYVSAGGRGTCRCVWPSGPDAPRYRCVPSLTTEGCLCRSFLGHTLPRNSSTLTCCQLSNLTAEPGPQQVLRVPECSPFWNCGLGPDKAKTGFLSGREGSGVPIVSEVLVLFALVLRQRCILARLFHRREVRLGEMVCLRIQAHR